MSDLTDQELIDLLHQKQFKATPQRLAICRLILESKNHPTAEMIYKKIIKEYKTISQATVYKTLALMKELGLVSELSFNEKHSKYDPNISTHINLICPKCDNITDFESTIIDEFWQKITKELGNNIIGQRLDVYKLCNKCLKKEKSEN
ncbi:MAG: transcriptional repressor [Candidatus Heimdallarchaeota archaeon]|nr:transcriptional repressor [Candidatus Heimdallarchaeota archaeon]